MVFTGFGGTDFRVGRTGHAVGGAGLIVLAVT